MTPVESGISIRDCNTFLYFNVGIFQADVTSDRVMLAKNAYGTFLDVYQLARLSVGTNLPWIVVAYMERYLFLKQESVSWNETTEIFMTSIREH